MLTAPARRPRGCAGSPGSMPSRPTSVALRPNGAAPSARHAPRRWSRSSASGSTNNAPASRRSPASARPWPISPATGAGWGCSSTTGVWRWTPMPWRTASGPWPRRERTHCSRATTKGRPHGGRIASLIETSKMNGVEPYAYLKATLEAIAAGHPASRIRRAPALGPYPHSPLIPVVPHRHLRSP